MAKKISQLTQATQVKSDDVTVIVQDGETKKLPLNTLVTKQDIENKKVAGLAKLDEIEATYENDTYTPTITVKNKSSVKVGEGDGVDYSANVMDGHVKSAILKGQTLVNIFKSFANYSYSASERGVKWLITGSATLTETLNNDELTMTLTGVGSKVVRIDNVSMLKPNTKYMVKINYTTSFESGINFGCVDNSVTYIQIASMKSNEYAIFTTPSDLSTWVGLWFGILRDLQVGDVIKISKPVFIEYQDGMENWDIPYFEGMQSVQMPVLTTVGKNLFDGYLEKGILDGNTGKPSPNESFVRSVNFIKVQSNKIYTISEKDDSTDFRVYEFDGNFNYIGELTTKTFTTSSNTSYIKFRTYPKNSGDDVSSLDFKFMLETGNTITPYEPYKSNILTVNEDVTLRGVGDVTDTLDCLTGEVVERIGEIVLDGSETNWGRNNISNNREKTSVFTITKREFNANNNSVISILSNSLQSLTANNQWSNDIEGVALNTSNTIIVAIDKNKLKSDSLNGFKTWLSQNPITIQCIFASESVKTVDLMPSGTHPSTTPYCWKNGHIQLSSSGLLPNLEYSVVTSRAGQINQNATMIVKNDKRIFDLEILLAGGLVNTTYQALTLQNQVETGLSKVSLSSETEPDYLLYHMIMKLIEEKAYKLDDLTEKVSVFYLYEKLSDEQFETIYSALYPFVEDEIVEEPVVEELPEVVEDEVIM